MRIIRQIYYRQIKNIYARVNAGSVFSETYKPRRSLCIFLYGALHPIDGYRLNDPDFFERELFLVDLFVSGGTAVDVTQIRVFIVICYRVFAIAY